MNSERPTPADILNRLNSSSFPRPNLETPFAKPTGRAAELVADCWCEVLHITPIGADDNFFDLGGDSVLMTLVIARVRERTGAELSFADFFNIPTVSGLAIALEQSLQRLS